jgi:hypothetical protein
MIKIFIPKDKGRQKSNVRGFWKNPAGKVYYDYLTIQNYQDDRFFALYNHLEGLRLFYQQESIFFINIKENTAHCFSGPQDILDFKNCCYVFIPKDKNLLRQYVRKFLKIYGGVTVYKEKEGYRIESWEV